MNILDHEIHIFRRKKVCSERSGRMFIFHSATLEVSDIDENTKPHLAHFIDATFLSYFPHS